MTGLLFGSKRVSMAVAGIGKSLLPVTGFMEMLLRKCMAGKFSVTAVRRINSNLVSVHNLMRQLALSFQSRLFSSSDPQNVDSKTQRYPNLTTLVDGCDYRHWLVVMKPPEGYPLRDQIVQHYYVKTLALAFGSEEEAKKSIYSVSTKYYYSFSCEIPEILIHKIRALPNVMWVLPDSFLPPQENYYGVVELGIQVTEKSEAFVSGEPFVDGEVVPYDEKYHADWLRDENNEDYKKRTCDENNEEYKKKPCSRRARRKQKKKSVEKVAGEDLNSS